MPRSRQLVDIGQPPWYTRSTFPLIANGRGCVWASSRQDDYSSYSWLIEVTAFVFTISSMADDSGPLHARPVGYGMT